ncbi:hypothetical protein APHAL10511_004153 [Amanita phalloides]|nr:hypothetical protein APHAL10511_004153 [Amanita phalloides]
MLPAIDQFDPFNVLIPLFILLGALFLSRSYFNGCSGTRLKGPPSNSFLFGRLRDIHTSNDRASVYKRWAKEYGHVFEIPIQFGKRNVILCDPKAIAHVFSKDTFTYFTLPFVKAFRKAMAGRSMLDEEGEEHRRLRRILSPAFSYPALRGITHVFYDAAYKAKSSWEVLLMSSDEVIFDVQEWMDRITLDSIGISGFSYDFKALEGSQSAFTQALDSFNEDSVENARLFMFIGLAFPQILYLPTRRTRLFKQMRQEAYNIGAQLLEKSQKVMEGSNVNDRSILGLLCMRHPFPYSTNVDIKLD